MKFKSLFILMVVFVLALGACAPAPVDETDVPDVEATEEATEEAAPADDGAALPAACEEDAFGCAVIPAGETIKIGMGAPMLGDYSMFGIDISQAVAVALSEDDGFEGWSYELIAEDTGGTPEGGAAVANKLVTDPTVVAIAGHIFSGSTDAAMPIYEKAGLPMMSPSRKTPRSSTAWPSRMLTRARLLPTSYSTLLVSLRLLRCMMAALMVRAWPMLWLLNLKPSAAKLWPTKLSPPVRLTMWRRFPLLPLPPPKPCTLVATLLNRSL
jgi:hypothetical protein